MSVLLCSGCQREAMRPELSAFDRDQLAAESLAQAFVSDLRIPSASNLSGVWTSGPNLGGYDIQLEQRADAIDGRGYFWGCTGYSAPFTVNGAYKNGVLSLRFSGGSASAEPREYSFAQAGPNLTLQGTPGRNNERLFRAHDIRRLEK
ncbi:MAG: hypothetical protein JWL90_3169 [Chthoniobacteraceae bacterium]|nr:hypothetical protein [Chthoniobacteraceae bacterium]